jgi:hypothetical protein
MNYSQQNFASSARFLSRLLVSIEEEGVDFLFIFANNATATTSR